MQKTTDDFVLPQEATTSSYRIGIIGCGGITERRHGPVWSAMKDKAQIVALCDVSPERLSLMGEKLNVAKEHHYTDYQQMLAKEQLDIVDIATSHGTHEELAGTAAEAGVHVVLEKPIARTVEEADRMIAVAAKNKVKLGVAHNQLFTPACRETVRIISEGVIGEPFLIRTEGLGGSHVVGRGQNQHWRITQAGSGGGPLIDNGYHQLYRIRAWMNSPVKRVTARIGTFFHDIEVEDLALLLLEHENGGITSLQTGWCAPSGAAGMEEIFGRKGSIKFGQSGSTPIAIWTTEKRTWEKPELETEEPDRLGFPTFLQLYLEAIEKDGPVPVSGEDAREILNIVTSAYESGRTGKTIDLV